MTKYRVRLTEKVNYWVDVEAETEDEAGNAAEKIWLASADRCDDFEWECVDVYASGVTRVKKEIGA
jgi:hypothetical protein